MLKTAALFSFFHAFIFLSLVSTAQTTQSFIADDLAYRDALELFDREKYEIGRAHV